MKHFRTCAGWGLAVAAVLLSPIVVILGIPLAFGIGFDIFDLAGEGPVTLALCVPLAFVLLRRAEPRALLRRLAAALLRPRRRVDHPAELDYAPKSMS